MPTVTVSFLWEDAEGAHIPVPLYFDIGDVSTLAIAQTQFTGYETLLHAISGAAIVKGQVTFPLTAALTESPDSGYYVDSGAYLAFTDSNTVGQGFYLPSILQGKIAQDVVNSADTDVAALITAATGGGALEPLSTAKTASLWTDFREGVKTTRKVRRR